MHVSLRGLAFAAGPWFLIDAEWKDRCEELKQRCVRRVKELGYELHDVERNGEKESLEMLLPWVSLPCRSAIGWNCSGVSSQPAWSR